ncbi:hypothetical protein EDF46_0034 [Frondihabitans sp. PhB188]|nr:hypothetical protein EDF46_0034 [Frondihabitans sp. PhB188]
MGAPRTRDVQWAMAVQNATIVAVIGARSAEVITALGESHGVDALVLGEPDDHGTKRISASNAPYVVHDADPLGHVAHAWVEFYDDRSTAGALELEAALAAPLRPAPPRRRV